MAHQLFVARMQDAQYRIQRWEEIKHAGGTNQPAMHGFCYQTRALFIRYGAAHEWSVATSHTKTSWTHCINSVKVHMRKQWQITLAQRAKTNLYLQMRTSSVSGHEVEQSQLLRWRTQNYLSRGRGLARIGGQWKLRMRVHSVELNVMRAMESGRGLPPQSARCYVCDSSDDESYHHFLFECKCYCDIREPMLQALHQEYGIIEWLLASPQMRVHMALTSQAIADKAVRLYLATAFRMRAATLMKRKRHSYSYC